MAAKNPWPAIVITSLILIFGIIHLGVGIGIVAKYRQYGDILQQSVGLASFNIVIGIYGIVAGALGLFAVLTQRPSLSKISAIISFILGTFAVGSFIAALVINSKSLTYIKDYMTYYTNTYAANSQSNDVIDKIQSTFECCGVNLWLDWGRITLGDTTGVDVGRRRRRHFNQPLSYLTRAIRQKRQNLVTIGTVFNLPASYTINLPISCCSVGGTVDTNSLGGDCVFSAGNGTDGINIGGCLSPIANIAVSQITGIVVINTCLSILCFVLLPILMTLFPANLDPTNPNNKQPVQNEIHQEQQQPYYNTGYAVNNNNPNQYYVNNNNPNQYYANNNNSSQHYMATAAPNLYYSSSVPAYTVYQR